MRQCVHQTAVHETVSDSWANGNLALESDLLDWMFIGWTRDTQALTCWSKCALEFLGECR